MTSEDEWTEWVMSGEKRMALVPSEPDSVYASSGWSSWDDFLSIGASRPGHAAAEGAQPGGTAATAHADEDLDVRLRR